MFAENSYEVSIDTSVTSNSVLLKRAAEDLQYRYPEQTGYEGSGVVQVSPAGADHVLYLVVNVE